MYFLDLLIYFCICEFRTIYFIMCMQFFILCGTPAVEACDKTVNLIIYFCDVNNDSSDFTTHFLIAIEQNLMLESSNVFAAVFYLVASHYVFNLSYHSKVNYVLFLQEKVLDLPSTSVKRTPTSLTHFAGREHCRAEIFKQTESAESTDHVCVIVGDESGSEYNDTY